MDHREASCEVILLVDGKVSSICSQKGNNNKDGLLKSTSSVVRSMNALYDCRFFRKKWQKLDPKDKVKVKKRIWEYRGTLIALVAALCGGALFNYYMHLQSTPMTDRVRYVAFTKEQFKKIADYEFEMVSAATPDYSTGCERPLSTLIPCFQAARRSLSEVLRASSSSSRCREQTTHSPSKMY